MTDVFLPREIDDKARTCRRIARDLFTLQSLFKYPMSLGDMEGCEQRAAFLVGNLKGLLANIQALREKAEDRLA